MELYQILDTIESGKFTDKDVNDVKALLSMGVRMGYYTQHTSNAVIERVQVLIDQRDVNQLIDKGEDNVN